MYPEKYYFYKSREYNKLKSIIDYIPTKKSSTDYERCVEMSTEILEYVRTDEELCTCYEDRRRVYGGIDPEYHLLIQDILWSTTYENDGVIGKEKKKSEPIIEVIRSPAVSDTGITVRPQKGIDYEYEQKRNAETGLEGERYVMRVEEEKLQALFPDDTRKRPIHTSVVEGDGAGYEIQSYNERGEKILIEVKTTTGAYNTPFYMTRTELTRSEVDSRQYALYRVYNFKNGTGDIGITYGSMKRFCQYPANYKVILNKK